MPDRDQPLGAFFRRRRVVVFMRRRRPARIRRYIILTRQVMPVLAPIVGRVVRAYVQAWEERMWRGPVVVDIDTGLRGPVSA